MLPDTGERWLGGAGYVCWLLVSYLGREGTLLEIEAEPLLSSLLKISLHSFVFY